MMYNTEDNGIISIQMGYFALTYVDCSNSLQMNPRKHLRALMSSLSPSVARSCRSYSPTGMCMASNLTEGHPPTLRVNIQPNNCFHNGKKSATFFPEKIFYILRGVPQKLKCVPDQILQIHVQDLRKESICISNYIYALAPKVKHGEEKANFRKPIRIEEDAIR
ncbi:hypothetical protein TNCV_1453821 [Trichonephila clavipes]|nr:hypothetical protein TNCV_1453821 [Trichonephila clavipes]